MLIRTESFADEDSLRALHLEAFGGPEEAELVDRLRRNEGLTRSLVAEAEGRVVGHIAFSKVIVTNEDGQVFEGVGLGPMAVAKVHQRSGIGSLLVRESIARLKQSREAFCVVLGHPTYYPRFGFTRASEAGIRWEHDAPGDAFMVLALVPNGLAGVTGVVRYRPEFDGL